MKKLVALSISGLLSFGAGALNREYETHQSSINGDRLLAEDGDFQEPEMTLQEYLAYRLDMAQANGLEKKTIKIERSLPQLMTKVKKIGRGEDDRVPELLDVVRLMRDTRQEPSAKESMRALARIGTKNAIETLFYIGTRPEKSPGTVPKHWQMYKCNLARMAVEALKEADVGTAYAAIRNSECDLREVFVADGAEEGLQYLLGRNETRKLADFVIANHRKPYMKEYKTRLLGILSGALDDSTNIRFPYKCSSNRSAPVYAAALYRLDRQHAESFVNSAIRGKYCSNIFGIEQTLRWLK